MKRSPQKEEPVSRSPNYDRLLEAAKAARERAYALHSGYHVGAAILAANGEVFPGCNIENDTYGLTLCAERAAVAGMVVAGQREIREVLVVTEDAGTPCGLCRQTLCQFAPDLDLVRVWCVGMNGSVNGYTLAELFPHPFRLQLESP